MAEEIANKAEQRCKEAVPICHILNVNIAAVNMGWLIEYTKKNIEQLKGKYMTVANVHTTVMAYQNEQYRQVQNGAVLAIPDGGPLSALGRKRGFGEMQRTTGPDYMKAVFEISAEKGYCHFFYGATEETLKKLKNNLELSYPGLQVAGMYSPPFRRLTEQEDAQAVEIINKARPDFVWVGLGAPKQENWMADHQGKIDGFMVGVGAGFDYFAGNIKRAPRWMQKANLEWLYRLCQDPKRLFRRYLITNTQFIWYAVIRGK